jgi:multiple sugar transport system permease protein
MTKDSLVRSAVDPATAASTGSGPEGRPLGGAGRPRVRSGRPLTARRRNIAPLVLLAPFFVLFALTLAAPLLYAVGLSLFSEQRSGLGFGGAETVFSGLSNYGRALGSGQFRGGFAVLALYCLMYIPVMGLLAIGLALLLDSGMARIQKFFQVALFLPHVVPNIIAAIIWAYLYTPGISPFLKALAGASIELNLLGQQLILPSIVNIAVWEWTGYNVVIFYTALQAIDRSVIEAARVDGAGAARIAKDIKVPLIRSAIGVVLLFTIIGSLQLFSEPVILAQATTAVNSTYTPNMFAFEAAFGRSDFGLAAAASVLLAAAAAALSWAVTRFTGGRRTA